MDLIRRESVAEKITRRRDYVGRPSDPDCIIADEPTVPAVPLDELCEWLAGYAEPPLDALTICDNPFEAWKMTLTKWMEEQDAADRRR